MLSPAKYGNLDKEKLREKLLAPHGPGLLFLFTLISGLNILDSVFTVMILDLGGIEANPIVRVAIQAYGDLFWVWKYGVVSVASVMLCYCDKHPGVKFWLVLIALVYSAVVSYQITLLISASNPFSF